MITSIPARPPGDFNGHRVLAVTLPHAGSMKAVTMHQQPQLRGETRPGDRSWLSVTTQPASVEETGGSGAAGSHHTRGSRAKPLWLRLRAGELCHPKVSMGEGILKLLFGTEGVRVKWLALKGFLNESEVPQKI